MGILRGSAESTELAERQPLGGRDEAAFIPLAPFTESADIENRHFLLFIARDLQKWQKQMVEQFGRNLV